MPAASSDIIQACAGICHVPVPHAGNAQCSEEEADIILHLSHQLLGRGITTGESDLLTRSLTLVIVVGSPSLATTRVSTLDQLKKVNLVSSLLYC